MTIKVFPYALIRSAGIPFEEFIKPSNGKVDLHVLLNDYFEKDYIINLKKNELIQELQQILLSEKNNNFKKRIRKIKKNVQIGADLSENEFFVLVNPKTNGLLLNYKREYKNFTDDIISKVKSIYTIVLKQERTNLIEILKRDELKNALLLSSQILLQSLNKYNLKEKLPKKKFNQLEWSMYKYASRASTKTSPFSTFTGVGICNFNNESNSEQICANIVSSKSIVKFNSLVLRQFIICLKTNKQYRANFFIKCNPSITVEQDIYRFLINNQNIEIFQRLKKNDILNIIYEILQEEIRLKDLYKKLIEFVDDSEENIEYYLLDIINTGFIEMHPGFSELDANWEQNLLYFITSVEDSDALADKLKDLYFYKKLYESSKIIDERNAFLSKIQFVYQTVIELLTSNSDYKIKESLDGFISFYLRSKKPTFVFKKLLSQNILYEDILTQADIGISRDDISAIVEKVNSLTNATKLYIGYKDDFFETLNYFKTNYKEKSVNLLTFCENYFKHKQKEAASKNLTEQPTDIPEQLKKVYQLKKDWEIYLLSELAKNYNPEKTHFYMDIDMVKRTNDKLNLLDDCSKGSYSSFFQIFVNVNEDGEKHLMAVCSSAFNGYGRFYSRFLNDFSQDILQELKNSITDLMPHDSVFVENIDSSIFNANHHPPIMDYEIQIPGVRNLLPPSNTIALRDLCIKLSSCEKELLLYHKETGKRVYVFDLCFQTIKGRSNLYRLLEIFSKVESVTPSYLNGFYKVITLKDSERKEYKIKYYPRVIFENTIVIKRSIWIVPKVEIIMTLSH